MPEINKISMQYFCKKKVEKNLEYNKVVLSIDKLTKQNIQRIAVGAFNLPNDRIVSRHPEHPCTQGCRFAGAPLISGLTPKYMIETAGTTSYYLSAKL